MIDITEENFSAKDFDTESILNFFTCMMCYGIAQNPLKCNKCETVYCKACLPNTTFSCFKKCGSVTT